MGPSKVRCSRVVSDPLSRFSNSPSSVIIVGVLSRYDDCTPVLLHTLNIDQQVYLRRWELMSAIVGERIMLMPLYVEALQVLFEFSMRQSMPRSTRR